MNSKCGRKWLLVTFRYCWHFLGRTEKNNKELTKGLSLGWDLNSGLPRYAAGMLTIIHHVWSLCLLKFVVLVFFRVTFFFCCPDTLPSQSMWFDFVHNRRSLHENFLQLRSSDLLLTCVSGVHYLRSQRAVEGNLTSKRLKYYRCSIAFI